MIKPSTAIPDFLYEDRYEGLVCGLDEVGRGPLAGPVVAACVVIPEDKRDLDFISDIRDSKKLSLKKREELYRCITGDLIFGIAEIPVQKIDEINILQASLLAMAMAFENTDYDIHHALVDGNRCPSLPCAATPVVKGDGKSVSIAAASILAKVTRDRIMAELAGTHPHYGWERNAGYGTRDHLEAIDRHGVAPHHRRSFAPIKNFLEFGQTRRQLDFAV